MLSHIVILWTDPTKPGDAEAVLQAANRLLKNIPGIVHFHSGKMSPSSRPVVEQTYSVALNMIFASKQAEAEYQIHPQHLEFVNSFVKPLVKKVLIYDFE